jgi:hypothetical protein
MQQNQFMSRPRASAPTGLRELFRYRKASRTRIYNLGALSEHAAELWVASEAAGKVSRARRLVTFDTLDDAAAFLDDIERELRQGGWSKVS